MKEQFDVWEYNFPVKGPHPVVLISHPDRCARAKHVNVLFCTSQRQGRQPYAYEVMLATEDGLNWETFCDCSIMWVVPSDLLTHQHGHVSLERRLAIRLKLREFFRLSATD
jgi:mRNA-degrading endonuclease toxin of MazEF toxin-antitoxin module